jgi:hypothetical protein
LFKWIGPLGSDSALFRIEIVPIVFASPLEDLPEELDRVYIPWVGLWTREEFRGKSK